MKVYETIKKGFFHYCGITQKGIDSFWRQILIEKVNISQKINASEFYTLSLAKRRKKNLFDKLDLNKLYVDLLEYIDKIWKNDLY